MKNNQLVYEQLTKNRVHWDRKDSNTIIVWTSGYKTGDCHTIEKFLLSQGFRSTGQTFDKISGKTVTYYKHN